MVGDTRKVFSRHGLQLIVCCGLVGVGVLGSRQALAEDTPAASPPPATTAAPAAATPPTAAPASAAPPQAAPAASSTSLSMAPSASTTADMSLPPPPSPSPEASHGPTVGGHIGIATPLVTVSKKTTTISDQATILDPIGVSVVFGNGLIFDFETVVANPVHPKGTTGFVVDPGILYDWGGIVTGLRVAFQTNSDANVGLIPLIHKAIVDLGGANWFLEAAFPTFYQNGEITFNAVAHTGIGF